MLGALYFPMRSGLWFLLAGFLIGAATIAFGVAYLVRVHSRGVATIEFIRLHEESKQAFAAYRHETKPVAIATMGHYLGALERAESKPEIGSFLPKGGVAADLMFAHARLAKLYAENSQSALSTQQVAQALACAKRAGHWSLVTNWAILEEFVDRIDKAAKD